MNYSIEKEKFQAMKRYRREHLLPYVLMQYSLRVVLLIGFFLISSLTCLSTVCSSIKLLILSLPSILTAISSPKCIFLISNIIVILLICEWRHSSSLPDQSDIYEEYVMLSQRFKRNASCETKDAETEAPTEGRKKENEEEIDKVNCEQQEQEEEPGQEKDDSQYKKEEVSKEEEEEEGEEQGQEKDDSQYKKEEVFKEEEEEENEGEEQEQEEEKEEEEEEEEEVEEEQQQQQQQQENQEQQEESDLATEELNRRVEDFIANFNMKLKLEERMLILCHG